MRHTINFGGLHRKKLGYFSRIWVALLVVELFGGLATSLAQTALPQEPADLGLPEVSGDCQEAVLFGGNEVERSAYCELQKRRYASARTLARKALEANPNGFRPLYLLGVVQHRGEGNLPKALRLLERSEKAYTLAHGWDLTQLEPESKTVGYRILFELMDIHGEMDHHEQRINYANSITDRLDIDYNASKAWPLMKLGRFEEARAVVEVALASEDLWNRSVARTSLCAIESELRRRDEAYEACREAAELARQRRRGGAVELTNAGAAAEEIFLFGEAERLYLEAAQRPPETSVNPWGRLVHLYLAQGRFPEALAAWRSMLDYRARRPHTYLNQQDEAEAQLAGASVMLVAGRADLAEPSTRAIMSRPDRQGTSSAAAEQNEAGAALVARVTRLMAARQLEQEAVIAPLTERLVLNLKALRLRWDAWLAGQLAARTLAKAERLVATLRPEVPGSLELPSWLDAEVIGLVGPGIAKAALEQARSQETLGEELVEPIFAAYAAEIAWLQGRYIRAFDFGQRALETAPKGLSMVAARAIALAGASAAKLGRYSEARAAYREAMARDPGVFIRLGLKLPVNFKVEPGNKVAISALRGLKWSPMFRETSWGFTLLLKDESAHVLDRDGSELSSAFADEERELSDPSRRLARSIQRRLLSPKLDITQVDVSSLDGGVGGGTRALDHLDLIQSGER